jgi:predicted ATPase
VPAVSSSQVILEVELVDGTRVRAPEMSEGLLLYLAYAAIPYVHAVRTLLIEEPETGLHPARIRELLTMLRDFATSTGTQVLMSTHSPLVVNELNPGEVIVLTRSAKDGTRAVALKDTPQFDERSKVYALGELWLSYADGDREAALLDGTSP